jgi:hypothetical protein
MTGGWTMVGRRLGASTTNSHPPAQPSGAKPQDRSDTGSWSPSVTPGQTSLARVEHCGSHLPGAPASRPPRVARWGRLGLAGACGHTGWSSRPIAQPERPHPARPWTRPTRGSEDASSLSSAANRPEVAGPRGLRRRPGPLRVGGSSRSPARRYRSPWLWCRGCIWNGP